MVIVGRWLLCDDGVMRPVIDCRLDGPGGQMAAERFLIDSGADRTVLSADLLSRLGLRELSTPAGVVLAGVGGSQSFVLVQTVLEFEPTDGPLVRVRGELAAFQDPSA